VIVVDASALVAIGDEESDADVYFEMLADNEAVTTSINYVETGIILIRRGRMERKPDFDVWLKRLGVRVHGADDLATPALAAYLAFGRGYHPARLNLADCFAYALAKQLDAPLLFKGADFALTDVRRALQPT
jgi:ribonuclease VapC